MQMSFWAVLAATVTMFIVGMVWYMFLFSKQWGEMFGFDKLSKKKQKEMQKEMGPFYMIQILVTIFSAFTLAKLMALLPNYNVYALATLVWFGFVTPVIVSGVIFGGVEAKWIPRRISIMAGDALVHFLAAAWVINLIQN